MKGEMILLAICAAVLALVSEVFMVQPAIVGDEWTLMTWSFGLVIGTLAWGLLGALAGMGLYQFMSGAAVLRVARVLFLVFAAVAAPETGTVICGYLDLPCVPTEEVFARFSIPATWAAMVPALGRWYYFAAEFCIMMAVIARAEPKKGIA